MNNKISNPLLKQLISEIAKKTNEGRLTNISWKTLSESRKLTKEDYDWRNDPVASREFEKSGLSAKEFEEEKGYNRKQNGASKSSYSPRKTSFKGITFFNVPAGKESVATQAGLTQLKSGKWGYKHRTGASASEQEILSRAEQEFGPGRYWEPKNKVNEAEKKQDDELPDLGDSGTAPETPDDNSAPDAGGGEASAPGAGEGKGEASEDPAAPEEQDAGSEEETEKAQADAVKTKAELEKAKAEKDRAEKEIKKNTYIKLRSGAGTQFLLGKILDHAFKTNTIDALASEMVQKLKIQTPEDMIAFSEDTAPYRVIPGMAELMSSMKMMATKAPNQPDETP